MRNYGLIDNMHLDRLITEVCECLGYGQNNNADKLLSETAGAETNRGQTKDGTVYAGMGLTQFDKMPFYDTKHRCSQAHRERLLNYFDIDISFVEWEHIRYNPLLALIFTRLKYKKIPEAIPETLAGRAYYWKEHYNSILGKGTVEHYMEATLPK